MQYALKNTNSNAIELKETITECISKEKKLKQRIKDLEEENEKLGNKNLNLVSDEKKHKEKIESLKYENQRLKDNVEEALNDMKNMRYKHEDLLKGFDNTKRELKKKDELIL